MRRTGIGVNGAAGIGRLRDSGAAFVFKRENNYWEQVAYISVSQLVVRAVASQSRS